MATVGVASAAVKVTVPENSPAIAATTTLVAEMSQKAAKVTGDVKPVYTDDAPPLTVHPAGGLNVIVPGLVACTTTYKSDFGAVFTK